MVSGRRDLRRRFGRRGGDRKQTGNSRGMPDRQSSVRRVLGVSRATVSRMLHALEAKGLVTRERAAGDRRQVIVRITGAGARLVQRIVRCFVVNGVVYRLMRRVVSGRHARSVGELNRASRTVEAELATARATLGDSAGRFVAMAVDCLRDATNQVDGHAIKTPRGPPRSPARSTG